MRIERIEIDGFGRFHEERWPLDGGLTVLVGATEAGKTTLLNALRALLFGFEATRDGRTWYPPLGGGRRGGRLVLQTAAGERWTVERHGERGEHDAEGAARGWFRVVRRRGPRGTRATPADVRWGAGTTSPRRDVAPGNDFPHERTRRMTDTTQSTATRSTEHMACTMMVSGP